VTYNIKLNLGVRSCRECPQALREEFSFRFILHR